MQHSDAAWVTIAAGVIAYEASAPEGELLSQAVGRYRERHPILVTLMIVYLAAHLLRVVPARADPLHRLAVRLKR